MIFLDLFEKLPHRSIFGAKGIGCHRRSGPTASCDGGALISKGSWRPLRW